MQARLGFTVRFSIRFILRFHCNIQAWVYGRVWVGGRVGISWWASRSGSLLEYYYKYTMTITHDALDLTIQIPWTCSNLCNLGLTVEGHPSPIDYSLQPEPLKLRLWLRLNVVAGVES